MYIKNLYDPTPFESNRPITNFVFGSCLALTNDDTPVNVSVSLHVFGDEYYLDIGVFTETNRIALFNRRGYGSYITVMNENFGVNSITEFLQRISRHPFFTFTMEGAKLNIAYLAEEICL